MPGHLQQELRKPRHPKHLYKIHAKPLFKVRICKDRERKIERETEALNREVEARKKETKAWKEVADALKRDKRTEASAMTRVAEDWRNVGDGWHRAADAWAYSSESEAIDIMTKALAQTKRIESCDRDREVESMSSHIQSISII